VHLPGEKIEGVYSTTTGVIDDDGWLILFRTTSTTVFKRDEKNFNIV